MGAAAVPNFGDLLRRYRLAAGLTHAALAERAGLSIRAISDLERGVNRRPRRDTFALLAGALNLSPDERVTLETALHGGAAPGDLRGASLPFVGRASELTAIQRFLASEGPPLLTGGGEPGIGKSRLLQEAALHGSRRGWVVLASGCHRRSGEEPYSPLLGALERHIEALAPAQRRIALHGCAWLARLLPELAEGDGPLPSWNVPEAQERRLIFKAVARYLANVAGPSGTLLLLDDLQWAGQDALDLLAALLRSPGKSPLRAICMYRDTEVPVESPLAALQADLAHAGFVRNLALGPLPQADAATLVTSVLEGTGGDVAVLREEAVRRAEGVPFFLVSCALALRAAAEGTTAPPQDVPWDVGETVRQRVAILPAGARDLLGAAAVAGRRVPRARLVALAARLGYDEASLLTALDAACGRRLLVEDIDAYQFAHDLIRETVAADLGLARRAALHLQVAEVLEAEPGEPPAEALAFHYTQADAAEKAVVYLERAGDRAAAMHANAKAESHYLELIQRLDTLQRPVEAARVREKLAHILRLKPHFDRALALLEEALYAYRAADDLEGMASAGEYIGWVHMLRGTMADGLPVVTGLLDDLTRRGLSAGGLAKLYIGLAQLYVSAGRYRELGEAAQRAYALAQEAGDERTAALALSKRAIALCELGQIDEGTRALESVRQSMEATGDEWRLITVLNNLAVIYDNKGDFQKALDCLERALRLSERIGDLENTAFMLYRRGQESFFLGDWVRARADYERSVALIREVGDARGASYPPSKLARLALSEGRFDEASTYFDEALDSATRKQDAQVLRYIHMSLAERDLLEGHPDAALERLLPLLPSSEEETASTRQLLPFVAWAYLELGDVSRAREVIEQVAAYLLTTDLRVQLLPVLQVQAAVAVRESRWEDAASALDEALTLARAMPHPYAEAQTLYRYGLLHTGRGEPDRARERFEEALAILNRLGERLYASHAERALASLPERQQARAKGAATRRRP
jgi:tetratricopeptide (TPR) repeat protein/transcriptional regulator with XRE-family HTH domain